MKQQKRELEQREMQECTFSPRLNTTSRSATW
jgi:hypothetical protein